ncbi:hypothetical protein CTI12_AA456810 [Artemisia annua]|uniref:Reverse transcriptase zinc-binding domain-containing protein n=1 Tax=Artemisia annua TaxID=35608 RepID=A0A2U1LT75_ARTAN|nr:hypothetical protein CTI12_AA456810 [Artemisia annua]
MDHASSSSKSIGEFWKQIWRLNVIPKIRLFLWKACSNALATRDGLFRRNCVSSPLCPICRTNPETKEHLLFECEWTKPIWFGSSLGLRLDGILGNISDRINSLLSHIKAGSSRTKFLSTFASVAWSIWKTRNRFIFEHSVLCLAQVILEAQVNDSDFEKAHSFDPASDLSSLSSDIQDSKTTTSGNQDKKPNKKTRNLIKSLTESVSSVTEHAQLQATTQDQEDLKKRPPKWKYNLRQREKQTRLEKSNHNQNIDLNPKKTLIL